MQAVRESEYETDCFKGFTQCLTALSARDISLAPLHIKLYISGTKDYINLPDLLAPDHFPEPMTCEFLNTPRTNESTAWELAYDLGAVVHLDHANSSSLLHDDPVAVDLASIVDDLIMEDEESSPPGRLFLCDVSRLVLSAQEFLAAPNRHDAAMLKIYAHCDFDLTMMGREVQESRWEYFTARVKLVDAGYRPSKEEMEAIALRRSVFHDTLGV